MDLVLLEPFPNPTLYAGCILPQDVQDELLEQYHFRFDARRRQELEEEYYFEEVDQTQHSYAPIGISSCITKGGYIVESNPTVRMQYMPQKKNILTGALLEVGNYATKHIFGKANFVNDVENDLLAPPIREAIHTELEKLFLDKVIANLGLCVSIEGGFIYLGDGSPTYTV
ncbi:hypothetical protein PIB30_052562 [Stylosanthes scabra]|uniref:Uncharacterized protein n=1 Tax=Stylosanthes scabra TaxID=79078 RepID=A0ABU6WI41_9FABA|nr:hypothetical protein [Stylosanthes scabra]